MKDMGPASQILGIQIERNNDGIILHQTKYAKKLLAQYKMQDAKGELTPLIVRSLSLNNDVYGEIRDGETEIGPEFPYKEAVGALLYLASISRPKFFGYSAGQIYQKTYS